MAAAVVFMMSATPLYAQESRMAADFELGKTTEVLANMMREIESQYVDKVSADKILKNASRGIVLATDPYLEYLSESDRRSSR